MDSGNSGSIQSSSGGDEEYDSRAADSIFMTTRPPPHVGPISNPPPPPPLFDPLSHYMQLHQNPNSISLLNPNISWPRPTSLRSDPNSTAHDIVYPMLSSSPPFMSAVQPPPAVASADNSSPGLNPTVQNPNQTAARNPKKRSRASRRAPTTVLTTDTTNFRAMVQEFTGIPAPPFNNLSFPRSRLDLFGTRSAALDAAPPPPPPHLRRPFPQKVHSPPPFLASSSSSLLNSTTNNNIFSSVSSTSSSASSSTTPVNYQLPITQSSNLFNIPSPLLTSLLQTNPKFLFSSTSPAMAAKPLQGSFDQIPSNDIKMGGLEEFSLGSGNHVSATLGDLPNLISTDQIGARHDRHDNADNMNNNAGNWRNNVNGVRHDEGDDYQAQIRPVNGGYNNGKMNYNSASSSDFHGEKGPENIATRGEGMVESWICSSE